MASIKKAQEIRTHIDRPFENESIIIHFVGDISCSKYSEISYHTNPGYEICLIPYGKGLFKIQDQSYPVSNDQLFITKASQVHGGWPSKDNPYRILYICFYIKADNPDCSSIWKDIKNSLSQIEFPVSYDRHNMEDVHHRLLGEIISSEKHSREMIAILVQQFIILTLRNFAAGSHSLSTHSMEERQNLLASRVIHYIDEHIYQETRLDDISSELNYSVPYLCRYFKEQTGFTVMEYYNIARLERAKKHLMESGLSISDISEKLNYNSIHHFSNAFKALFGHCPSHYRKATHID